MRLKMKKALFVRAKLEGQHWVLYCFCCILDPQDLITGSVLISSYLSNVKPGVSFHFYSDDSQV